MDKKRFGIDELANLVGVSRRTVRFYVQQGLLQPPLGVGRGKHYGPEHLARLRAVKALQVQGLSLDEVRRKVSGEGESAEVSALAATPVSEVSGSRWTRLEVAPGVELHLAGGQRGPSARGLRELEAWCRRHLGAGEDENDVFPERLRKLAEQLRQSKAVETDDDPGAE